MMRSFGSRPDTAVVDEPLYAHYLDATGIDHPGRAEILASQPRRWEDAVDGLLAPLPGGATVHYQKHMTHHLLPRIGRSWLGSVSNAFLIRDPAYVVASYSKVRGEPTLADLGYPQQVSIFRDHGGPVVDAADVLRAPSAVLPRLCAALDIPWDPAMLSWPAGRRATDGVWAPHWYSAVEASTGFGPFNPAPPVVPPRLAWLVAEATPLYAELAAHKL
jgi:hypothetical protein